jgi:hypothetical protein
MISDRTRRRTVVAAFSITTLIVVVQWLLAQSTAPPNKLMIGSWCAFYLSCFLVIIYGGAKSAALEATVYVITIIGEAIAPDLVERLISRLPDAAISHELLSITAHLTLTLTACAILIGWGIVLVFQQMGAGHTPTWARIYIISTIVSAAGVIIWAVIDPSGFIGLEAAKNGRFIRGIWPSMFDSSMTYVRIVLTMTTMFLPWVKASMDGNKPNQTPS